MRKCTTVLIIFFLTLCPLRGLGTAFAEYSDHILQTTSRTTLGLGQILSDLKEAPLIFVGEQHSDTRHHDLQLRVLRTLHNLGTPVAIGLEMFQQGLLPFEITSVLLLSAIVGAVALTKKKL